MRQGDGGTGGPGDSTALALVAWLVIAAGGCGGGDQGTQAAQQAPAATAQPPQAAPGTDGARPADGAGQGQAVYARTCATCHQQNGQGLAPAFPPLDATIVAGDKTRLIRLVLHGMSGPITVQGRSYNNVMAPWKSLSDGDLAAVLSYVRTRFGNGAGPVTMEEVAAQRAATATRTTMWTPRELGF